MTEAHVIGGMIAAMGFFMGWMGAFSRHTIATQGRIWGGLFKGWKTREQAPIQFALVEATNFLGFVAAAFLIPLGLWIMVS